MSLPVNPCAIHTDYGKIELMVYPTAWFAVIPEHMRHLLGSSCHVTHRTAATGCPDADCAAKRFAFICPGSGRPSMTEE